MTPLLPWEQSYLDKHLPLAYISHNTFVSHVVCVGLSEKP